MTDKVEDGRLRWQCRRGIKEVEMVLLPYFEKCFSQACEREKNLFIRLLDCQDVDLFEWFTYRSEPDNEELAEIVRVVLGQMAS
ncbi:MAG: succinate dehydrogenase assembly factor 2 [Pseudomonadales bacterium]|nr:succinate dehydrogenase assembly factor 2 [Pseudomonadales bacterium]